MKDANQGFSVIEVIVATAIMGIVSLALTMTVATIFTGYRGANDYTVVSEQVQNADYWITRDVHASGGVTLTEPNGFPLTITIPVDNDPSHNYSIDYVVAGDQLKRQVYNSSHILTSEFVISEFIDGTNTAFSTSAAGNYVLNIKVSKGNATTINYYEIAPRLAAE